jgi:hypothetical protein
MKKYNRKNNMPISISSRITTYYCAAWLLPVVSATILTMAPAHAGVYQWGQTNINSTGNWSDTSPSKWVGGGNPGLLDSVLIDHSTAGPWTNVVDATATSAIQDLSYQGIGDEGGSSALGVNTTIAAGKTLSVVGPNGFSVNTTNALNFKPVFNFFGDTLVVSNPAANFIVNGTMSTANNTKYMSVDMSGLTNLYVTVSQVGVADFMLLGSSVPTIGGSQVKFFLARNNVIKAGYASDYSQVDFTNSIEFNRQSTNTTIVSSLGANMAFNLGQTNLFYVDSIGVGRGGANATGTPGVGTGSGYAMVFKSSFANSAAPTALAYFRSPTTNRMSLLAIGVDSGTNTIGSSSSGKNRGMVDLRGGKVDMLVDQIWLGRNRTNSPPTADNVGELLFDNGTVNANTVEVGYMAYTNAVLLCGGWMVVSTNGTLIVNTNLELGHTPLGAGSESTNVAATYGQLWITNGGAVLANKITVGQLSTNNVITVGPGSSLLVSNTIADATRALTTLNVNGGRLTFFANAGVTNAFVNNLLAAGSATIQIAGISGFASFPATNVLIAYQAVHATPQTYSIITPTNYNNLQIIDDIVAQTISLIIKTNAPQTLTWRGGQDSNWNHSSLNWVNASNNTVFFSEGDTVTFDDTMGVPTTISITEPVNPSQVGTGITVTNNVNNFTFSNGGGAIGATALVKSGTSGLALNCPTTASLQVNNGTLTGSGSANSVNVTAGATLNFSGTINGPLASAGNATLASAGQITGSATITGGTLNNAGTINGSFSAQTGSVINNSGTFTSIGSSSVATNASLNNSGTIYGAAGSTLTIAFGGTLTDTVQGTPDLYAPGSINLGTLIVSGTFNPGGTGNAVGTTKVTDHYDSGDQSGTPNGRVQLNAGSVTVFKVNSTSSQPNTELLSQNQILGPSQSFKAINGCTLIITNVGPTAFADGQTFQLFGNYVNGGNIIGAGLNTTNSYPIIQPAVPGPGLIWEMSQLYFNGTISVVSASSLQFTLTNTVSIINPSNIVAHLSWPADKVGGWVQQLNTTLTNGLSATNWVTPSGGYLTNLSSFTDVYLTNTLIADPNAPGSAVFYRFVYP